VININRKPSPLYDREKFSGGMTMNSGWKVFLLFALMFAAAFAAECVFVPNIVPVAFADDPQPAWAVLTAFLLRTLELMSGTMAIIGLLVMFGVLAERLRGSQGEPEAVRSAIEPR
jgi:hypothetical protein